MFETLTWLVPAAVVAAGVWRPRAGLLVLAAALPLFGSPPGGPYLAALDVAALAAVGTGWRAGPAPRSRLDLPVLAFVAISLASMAPLAYQPPSWRPAVLLELLQAFPAAQASTLLYTWRAAANLMLGWALYLATRRAFHGHSLRPLGIALGAGLVPTLLLGFASRAGVVDLWAYRPIGGALFDARMHSLFFHSGWLAEYLVLVTPVAAAALIGRRAVGRGGAILLVLLASAAGALTLQRGAWFTALAQVAWVVLWLGAALMRRGRVSLRVTALVGGAVVLAGALTVTAFPGVLQPVRERLDDDLQLSGRQHVWRDSAEMMAERPAMGWGLGSFVPAHEGRELKRGSGKFLWLTPHNHYLMISVERGLLGLLAFLFVAWGVAGSLRTSLRDGNPERRWMARGLVIVFVGFAVYGLVQYLFFLKAIEWLCWILLGGAATLSPEPPRRRSELLARGLVLAALLLVPWRWIFTPPLEAAGDRSFGFHPTEVSGDRAFSWIEDRAARRLVRQGKTLVLELANGHPRAAERPVEVTVRLQGRVVERATLLGGWQELRVAVEPAAGEWVVLDLEARPAFRPFSEYQRHAELGRSRDIRLLGVAVGPIRWE